GERVDTQESYAHQTDDRGMYRLFGLRPGSYLVCAEGDLSRLRPSAYRSNAAFWYPSGTRTAAVEINIAPRMVSENVDFVYRAQQGHTISGEVALKSGESPTSARVYLLDPGTGLVLQSAAAFAEFTLYGVADGEYDIEANTSEKPDKSRMISPKQHVKIK